ncbi:MAG: type II toxin-antitoxin system VapC family toxin [Planctomycetota bacterium]
MNTLVDTCVLSEARRADGDPRVRQAFGSFPEAELYVSVVTFGELRKGIERLAPGKRKRELAQWLEQITASIGDRALPFDAETAAIWGELTAKAERVGRPIPIVDSLIAATAIQHGLQLMTRNVADFEPAGVRVINPWGDGREMG